MWEVPLRNDSSLEVYVYACQGVCKSVLKAKACSTTELHPQPDEGIKSLL